VRELIEGTDFEVVDEGLGSISDYLERTSRNAFLHFAAMINNASSGRRGKYATIALNMANVTSSKEGISRVYEQHPEVIDQYFEYVDLIALAKKMELDRSISRHVPIVILKTGGLLLVGVALGVIGFNFYNQKK
jgi:hypothetical protein